MKNQIHKDNNYANYLKAKNLMYGDLIPQIVDIKFIYGNKIVLGGEKLSV